MKRAAAAWKEIQAVNEKGPWKPTDTASRTRMVPRRQTRRHDQLGFALGAGAWRKAERHRRRVSRWLRHGHVQWMDYHRDFWGADFQYDDFFPLFRAEHYDPNAWMDLFQEAGVRYMIPMSKHHDGIAWWDSAWTKRSFVQMGPKKDLLTPLVEAAQRHGIKNVLYFTFEEYATAALDRNGRPVVRIWNFGPTPSQPLNEANRRRVLGSVPVSNYYDQYMMPLVKEMIDRFDPDGLWMDGDWSASHDTLHSWELRAYLYNKSHGRKEVYVNDRLGTDGHRLGDVAINEYGFTGDPLKTTPTHPWAYCHGISLSTAYNYADNEQSFGPPVKLVHMFINIISHNGNLDLLIGPDSSGRFPQLVVDRLKALGTWIRANSEAVYATRSLSPYAEGNVCYTRSKDGNFAYAICKLWPGKSLILKSIHAAKGATITMLGVRTPLAWQQNEQGLTITISDALQDEKARPCQYAWVVKIPMHRKS